MKRRFNGLRKLALMVVSAWRVLHRRNDTISLHTTYLPYILFRSSHSVWGPNSDCLMIFCTSIHPCELAKSCQGLVPTGISRSVLQLAGNCIETRLAGRPATEPDQLLTEAQSPEKKARLHALLRLRSDAGGSYARRGAERILPLAVPP